MGRALIIALAIVVAVSDAGADDSKLLGETPFAQAERLFAEATTFADQKDFVAAAIVFGQVQEICAGIERGPDGAIVDADAHTLRHDAINNEAASYSLARKPVEAATAFHRLRDDFAAELTAAELAAVDRKIALMEKQIGTITVTGTPADVELEVRLDGRRRQLVPGTPFRIEEGTHSLELHAEGYEVFVTEAAVLGGTDVPLAVTLDPLQTPAKVRIEATISGARVTLDGDVLGDAPIELSIAPGKHSVEVRAESYLEQTVPFEVGPGERTIVRVSLSKRRAPVGVRIAPYVVMNIPLRGDTPFGTWTGGGGIHLYHQALTYRAFRFGLAGEYNKRSLNELGIGAVATVCPDALTWSGGRFGVCPFQFAIHFVRGSTTSDFRTGRGDGRIAAFVEWRTDPTVVRLGGGLGLEHYGQIPAGDLYLVTAAIELSVGVDL